jgi:glycosyltransferase involved in cell wall biosynthesis
LTSDPTGMNKDNRFFSRVLIAGSCTVENRVPVLAGELLRKCDDAIRVSRLFLSRTDLKPKSPRWFLTKIFGGVMYHLLLPVLVFRSQLVFVLPSNNTEIGPIAFWAKRFRRPMVVDYYVSVYEWSCFMQGSGDATSRMGRKLLEWDRIAYQADRVIHCNMAEWIHIAEVLGLPPRREGIDILPLFTNFDTLVDEIHEPPAEGPFVFGWWGSSMPLHGLETILEGFKLLAESHSGFELHLCFLGKKRRDDFEHGRDLAAMPWLKIHHELVTADGSLPRFINERVHIGFSHFGTGPTADYVYTNKVLESIALGRTALVGECPGNHEYGDIDAHFYTCARTPEGIRDAAVRAMADPAERKQKESRCRRLFRARFNEAAARRRFHEILEDVFRDLRRA